MSYKAFAGCLITICDCYTVYIDSNYNNNDEAIVLNNITKY